MLISDSVAVLRLSIRNSCVSSANRDNNNSTQLIRLIHIFYSHFYFFILVMVHGCCLTSILNNYWLYQCTKTITFTLLSQSKLISSSHQVYQNTWHPIEKKILNLDSLRWNLKYEYFPCQVQFHFLLIL